MICSQLTREQSKQLYQAVLEDDDVKGLRRLCREDLFFLLLIAFRRKDVDNDWIYARCREVEQAPDGYIDLWSREHYKQNCLEEDIFTPNGWRKFGDIHVGDYVYAPDGYPVEVTWESPVTLDPTQYSIKFSSFQDDITCNVTAGSKHLWDVIKKNRKCQVWEEKLVNTQYIFDYTSKMKGQKRKRWLKIPYAKPFQLKGTPMPIDPYTLGVWLGDGACGSSSITNGNDHIINRVRGKITTIRKVKNTKVFCIHGLITELKKLGLGCITSKEKFIPSIYKAGSFNQRLELVRGLLDTDGCVRENGQVRFCSTSGELAHGLAEVLSTLGILPHVYKFDPPDDSLSKRCFVVTFNPNGLKCFTLPKHLKKIKKSKIDYNYWYIKDIERVESKPAKCISVDGGRYVIGKRNIPTHNSTVITYALTIQDILKDPEVTIGIFSHTRPIAKAFLTQIKRELEGNSFLKKLFPEILYDNPAKESPKWSLDEGIIVKRKSNPKESTVEAHGLVDGQPTSKHYSIMIYDDVVTRESVTTPDMIKKVTEAWELSLNLSSKDGRKRYIGTRYHAFDTYKTIMDRKAATPRLYPATDDGQLTGRPVLFTQKMLDDKLREMGIATASCQLLQNPLLDNALGFNIDWLQRYVLSDTTKWNLYLLCDPASSKKRDSDYTAMMVIGLAPDNNYYLVDGIRDRLNLTERAEALLKLHKKWKPKAVGYEKYGMMADIEHIKYVQEHKNYRFPIVELSGKTPKLDRIRRLVPIFEDKRFYLPEYLHFFGSDNKYRDFTKEFIEEEFATFPVCKHDDMLDCASRILDEDLKAVFPNKYYDDESYYDDTPVKVNAGIGW